MRIRQISSVWRKVEDPQVPMEGDIETRSLSLKEAQALYDTLTANGSWDLRDEIMKEWIADGLFTLVEDDQPTEQAAILELKLQNQVITSEMGTGSDQMEIEEKKPEAREALIEQYRAQIEQEEENPEAREALVGLYKARLEALDDEVIDQELRRFYADFVSNDKTYFIRELAEWNEAIQEVKKLHSSKAYVAELGKTKPVSLSTYRPLATYPFAYTGAKDVKECGFIAEVMRAAKGQGVRLVEPFVGGARVFLACDFAYNLIADLDPALYTLYTIIQQFPEFASQYCADIKKKHDAFGSYQALFDESVKYLNKIKNWKSLLTDVYPPDAKKDWARSYIFVRNRGKRAQVSFGKVQAQYQPINSEEVYQKEEQEALKLLSEKLRTRDQVAIKCQGWQKTFAEAEVGDIIYADPPYVTFTMAEGDMHTPGTWSFPWKEHEDLAKEARENADIGIPVFISNWATPEVLKLYHKAGATCIYTYCWKKSESKFVCLAAFLPS